LPETHAVAEAGVLRFGSGEIEEFSRHVETGYYAVGPDAVCEQ
jgi:hypothetical protein